MMKQIFIDFIHIVVYVSYLVHFILVPLLTFDSPPLRGDFNGNTALQVAFKVADGFHVLCAVVVLDDYFVGGHLDMIAVFYSVANQKFNGSTSHTTI